jgi:hypothetical protein
MKPTSFDLAFSDPELAKALTDARPPKGVKIGSVGPILQASHGADIVFKITFDFSMSVKTGVSRVVLVGVAAWIAKQLRAKVKDRKNKQARINGHVVPLDEGNVLRLIEKDFSNQIKRDAQWQENQQNKNRNRSKAV